jgi:hypothetical protein
MPKNRTLKSKHSKRNLKHKKHTKRHHKHKKYNRKSKRHNFNNIKRIVLRGGYGPGAGPVGFPWKSDESTWPGAYASNGGNTNGMQFSNYYQYNNQGTGVGGLDPAISTRGSLENLYLQSGGGIGQDLINLGRQAGYNVNDFISSLNGSVNEASNPNVTNQPINENYKIINYQNPNINQIISESANKVSNM